MLVNTLSHHVNSLTRNSSSLGIEKLTGGGFALSGSVSSKSKSFKTAGIEPPRSIDPGWLITGLEPVHKPSLITSAKRRVQASVGTLHKASVYCFVSSKVNSAQVFPAGVQTNRRSNNLRAMSVSKSADAEPRGSVRARGAYPSETRKETLRKRSSVFWHLQGGMLELEEGATADRFDETMTVTKPTTDRTRARAHCWRHVAEGKGRGFCVRGWHDIGKPGRSQDGRPHARAARRQVLKKQHRIVKLRVVDMGFCGSAPCVRDLEVSWRGDVQAPRKMSVNMRQRKLTWKGNPPPRVSLYIAERKHEDRIPYWRRRPKSPQCLSHTCLTDIPLDILSKTVSDNASRHMVQDARRKRVPAFPRDRAVLDAIDAESSRVHAVSFSNSYEPQISVVDV
eukprot:7390157-Prymnesium_polylepis.1